jgi:hypothetical protein
MSLTKAPTDTPWGEPISASRLQNGVFMVSTSSHGGILVSRQLAHLLSASAQQVGSEYQPGHPAAKEWLFFEEDCDARILIDELANLARTPQAA